MQIFGYHDNGYSYQSIKGTFLLSTPVRPIGWSKKDSVTIPAETSITLNFTLNQYLVEYEN